MKEINAESKDLMETNEASKNLVEANTESVGLTETNTEPKDLTSAIEEKLQGNEQKTVVERDTKENLVSLSAGQSTSEGPQPLRLLMCGHVFHVRGRHDSATEG